MFPSADTPIGRLGCAICYDWLFPEAMRQLAANGAEVLIRVSAYMDPWGATEPMDWWTVINRCRAHREPRLRRRGESGRQPAALPPYSWPGGSQIVDFDGRLLANASPGPGERIVVAPIDISALRHERDAHAAITCSRTCGRRRIRCTDSADIPRATAPEPSFEDNLRRIAAAKARLQDA
jgi:predicted amidohydrolase